jgi:hypothetical protein
VVSWLSARVMRDRLESSRWQPCRSGRRRRRPRSSTATGRARSETLPIDLRAVPRAEPEALQEFLPFTGAWGGRRSGRLLLQEGAFFSGLLEERLQILYGSDQRVLSPTPCRLRGGSRPSSRCGTRVRQGCGRAAACRLAASAQSAPSEASRSNAPSWDCSIGRGRCPAQCGSGACRFASCLSPRLVPRHV